MNRRLEIFFILVIITFGLSCQSVASQQDKSSNTDVNQEKETLIDTRTNSKYGLTLLFCRTTYENEMSVIVVSVKDDKTRLEKKLYQAAEEVIPAESRNLWSPDEEYLAAAVKNEINIYKASDLSKYFRKAALENSDVSKTEIKPFDSILLEIMKSNILISHKFERWQSGTSFIFEVRKENKKNQADNEKIFKYRYDTESKKLFYQCSKSEDDSVSKKCLWDASELNGYRKNADNEKKRLINPSQIEIEYY